MHSDMWKSVKEVLDQALGLEGAARRSFLSDLEISGEMRDEIESLVAIEPDLGDFLSLPASGFSKDFFNGDRNGNVPFECQLIGPYRTIRELGLGGMGAVFLAERQDGKFEQRVAIKVLKRELNVGTVRESFRREVEIQSKLVHPNVATIFDTGTTNDGIPYIVMEYVEGSSIEEYCLKRNLSLPDRLKLFNKICDAVSFAHQRLIVHRDLKPSNIIVTSDGNPKLLDFGISKLLGTFDQQAGLTALGAMTPEYASPEQVKGESVGTATDIYSLGVILYKLLTGVSPYDLRNKVNGDMFREITDSRPTLPSRASSLTKDRQINPAQLSGDLDNIILKALRKEPEERYRTVEQFSEDIWRYIDGLPVLARPGTVRYRAQKFLGRHRGAAAAGLIILVSMIGGSAVTIWQARVAQAQAVAAKNEQDRSEKISKFMFRVLSYANPRWYAEGAKSKGNARVIEVMFELSDKIDTEFANEPDVAAELHHRFAEVLLNYPDAGERAFFHLRRALELRKSYYGEWHELVAKDMYYFSAAGLADPDNRAAYLLDAIEMMRATNRDNLNLPYMVEDYVSRMLLQKYQHLNGQFVGTLAQRTGRDPMQVAEEMTIEADRVFRAHYDPNLPVIKANQCRLAYLQFRLGKIPDAETYESACRDLGAAGEFSSPSF